MTKPAQFNGLTGSVGDILLVMFGLKQHDSHVQRWRLLFRDRKLAADVAALNAERGAWVHK